MLVSKADFVSPDTPPNAALDSIGRTALSYAAWEGNLPWVRSLLADESVVVDHMDKHRFTPLMYAVMSGHIPVAECLLNAGAKPRHWNDLGQSILELAVPRNNPDLLQLLLDYLPSVDFPDDGRATGLFLSAAFNHLKSMRTFITLGANLNRQGPDRMNPLMAACRFGHFKAARELIYAGTDVNISFGRLYRTPLMFAIQNQKRNLIRQLLRTNTLINLSMPDALGFTALHHSAAVNDGWSAFVLLRAGVNKLWLENGGRFASELAAAKGHPELGVEIRNYFPALEDFCLRCIRKSLPSPLTDVAVCQLPLPVPMRRKILFYDC